MRNYVIGPVTEELYFRVFMCSLLIGSGYKLYSLILLCCFIYGSSINLNL